MVIAVSFGHGERNRVLYSDCSRSICRDEDRVKLISLAVQLSALIR